MEKKRNSNAIYKEMVSKLINTIHNNDYDGFDSLLDDSYTKDNKLNLYMHIANTLKDFLHMYQINTSVTEESENLILGTYCIYSEFSDINGRHFKKHTAQNALRGIINVGSVWKFTKSAILNNLYKNEYDHILKEYDILNTPDCISSDYELITKKMLSHLSFDIRVVSSHFKSDGNISITLAFLNGLTCSINNIAHSTTLTDANGNAIGNISERINIIFPQKMMIKTYTLIPKTPIDKIDLSWINYVSSYSYKSLL